MVRWSGGPSSVIMSVMVGEMLAHRSRTVIVVRPSASMCVEVELLCRMALMKRLRMRALHPLSSSLRQAAGYDRCFVHRHQLCPCNSNVSCHSKKISGNVIFLFLSYAGVYATVIVHCNLLNLSFGVYPARLGSSLTTVDER